MPKINMVIADPDKHYVESFIRFLSESYSSKIQLNYFTESSYLYDYLENRGQKADILLIGSALLNPSYDLRNAGLVVVLSSGSVETEEWGYAIVNKYQTGDKLISSVLNLYAEKFPNEIHMANGDKQTKIMAVFSPVGGVGKSTIAVALAAALTSRGKKTFYLNLENIQSTPVFFECANPQTLTEILYFLKDKHKALGLKIEGVKQVDAATGIHYFCPPESVSDIEALTPEELRDLLNQIRGTNKYDAIMIDMSGYLDCCSISIMDACDEIIVLADPGAASRIKIQTLEKELKLVEDRTQISIMEKCTLVMNKCNSPDNAGQPDILMGGKPVVLRIPKTAALACNHVNKSVINSGNEFGEAINKLSNRF